MKKVRILRDKKTESNKRSMTKSILWRIMGVIFLVMVTYYFTGSMIQTTMITFVHHFSFIWIYYFHERAWMNRFDNWGYKKYGKIFTYEIILGNCILGMISWIFTGSWTSVTNISFRFKLQTKVF